MTSKETITLLQTEYEALLERNSELEDTLAAFEADDGSRVPHEVALAIIRGESPVLAFRSHLGLTLRELSARTGDCRELPVRDRARAQAGFHFRPGPDRGCVGRNDRQPAE